MFLFRLPQSNSRILQELPSAAVGSLTLTSVHQLHHYVCMRTTITIDDDLLRYLSLLDGTRTLGQVIAEGGQDEKRILEDLVKLYDRGLLEQAGP